MVFVETRPRPSISHYVQFNLFMSMDSTKTSKTSICPHFVHDSYIKNHVYLLQIDHTSDKSKLQHRYAHACDNQSLTAVRHPVDLVSRKKSEGRIKRRGRKKNDIDKGYETVPIETSERDVRTLSDFPLRENWD